MKMEVILNCQRIKEIVELHDRIVVAIAKLLNATLITKDDKIISSGLVKTIW
jgi:PIN domain nuclease of toxin-antitoxin system